MRLICPECAAQYEIADGLIPPEGRDVECSGCGHGWRQPGVATLVLPPEAAVDDDLPPPLPDLPPDLPPGLPRASRGLTDPVLSILREEAERELSARAAERTPRRDPLAAGIAEATRRGPAGGARALPDPHALAASLHWQVPPRPAEEVIPPALPPYAPPPAATPPRPQAARAAASRAAEGQRAHDRGFRLGLLVAALLAGAYLAAPSLSGMGAAGAWLMQARGDADEARIWLQARAEAVVDRALTAGRPD